MKKVKKILIIRTDRFGEFILNTPVIRALRDKFSCAHITVMVNPAVREIIEGHPLINQVIIYEENKMQGASGAFRLSLLLRKGEFDLVVILNPKKEFHIATFLAGIPIRVGYNRKYGFLLNHKIEDKKSLGQQHEVEYNLDLIRSVGIEAKDKSLFVVFGPQDEEKVDALLKEKGILATHSLIALHPWTSDPLKQWPVENFSELANKILKELSGKIIIIGGKDEIRQSDKFCFQTKGMIDLTGRLNLRELAAFLKRCRLLISNDSGPVHMAGAVGTPVVVIFRNDIPGKNSKRWGPWAGDGVVIEGPDLSKIKTEDVFGVVKNRLS